MSLGRPLFLEGEAGVGKTELAKTIARWQGTELIRLQCYEGIDASQAVYDWDYSRQLLHLRAAEATGEASRTNTTELEGQLYNERFLLKRAILRAIDAVCITGWNTPLLNAKSALLPCVFLKQAMFLHVKWPVLWKHCGDSVCTSHQVLQKPSTGPPPSVALA
jgi:hypothetical protein